MLKIRIQRREATLLVPDKEAKARIQDEGIKVVTAESEEREVGKSIGLGVEVGRKKGPGVGREKRGREIGLRKENTGADLEIAKNPGNIPMMIN